MPTTSLCVADAIGDIMAGRLRATDRLFFAVFPEPAVARRIAMLGEELRCRHALKGKVLAAERLHVSLQLVGDYAGVPDEIVAAAAKVAATIQRSAFTATFKSAVSLRGRADNQPFVLRGNDGVIALTMLQQALGEAMDKAGLGRAPAHHAPHLTLMYGDRFVAEQALEQEICWAVHEFVLVHSLLGRGCYRHMDRFPLRQALGLTRENIAP